MSSNAAGAVIFLGKSTTNVKVPLKKEDTKTEGIEKSEVRILSDRLFRFVVELVDTRDLKSLAS